MYLMRRSIPLVFALLLGGCLPAPPQAKTAAPSDDPKTGPLPEPPPAKGVNTGEIPKAGALKPPVRKTTKATPDPKTTGKGDPQPGPKQVPPPPPDNTPHAFDTHAPAGTSKAITRFPGIRIYRDEQRVEIKGRVNLNRCPALEFMGCTPRGKTHESLLLFECEPKQLHLALIMLGLDPTPQISEQGEPIALEKGEKVVVEVSWEAKETPKGDPTAPAPVNGRVMRRVEDLIWDKRAGRSMPRVGWVFTGSRMLTVPAPPDYTKKMQVYAASYEGNLVATYHHPHVILDTPLVEGGDDTVYIPFTQRVPPRGTHIIIHIRAWKPSDGPGGLKQKKKNVGEGLAPSRGDDKKKNVGEGLPPSREDKPADKTPADKTPADKTPTDKTPASRPAEKADANLEKLEQPKEGGGAPR